MIIVDQRRQDRLSAHVPGDRKPCAVIDVGSNSVRLVVYEGLVSNALPIFNERSLCGLGRGMDAQNNMRKSAMDNALKSIERFVHLSSEMGAGIPTVVATAAVRTAAKSWWMPLRRGPASPSK